MNPSETRFRELLEAAPDAIFQVDENGRILLLNRAAESMFQYRRDELVGQAIEVLIPDNLRGAHEQHRRRYGERPATRAMGIGLTLLARRKDGASFPVEISLSPSQSGEGFRVTAVVRDVSERRRAEEEFRAAQERLVRELTAANRELELRNREVERGDRLKSEFLASMSHELRTPLHTIIGFAELLAEGLEGGLNSKQQRFVEHIRRDSAHLLELINDILDLSKIEAGRLELHPESIALDSVVEESLSSVKALARAKHIAVETVVDAAASIQADPLRIKQILVNLLSNAVKFTPEGGRVRVEAHRNDGDWAVIAVSDTGIGIPPEEHEAIFEKFHQVGTTTRGVREGTGLGLAITRRLVEQHGGRIELESAPGKGSRFTVRFPAGSSGVGGK
jgi:PAS domain S-box-containing protein